MVLMKNIFEKSEVKQLIHQKICIDLIFRDNIFFINESYN
jgi:hypothetical protein